VCGARQHRRYAWLVPLSPSGSSVHLAVHVGFDPLGLLDPVNSGGFINPQWLQYSEVGWRSSLGW
jgi:hypothetical protein